MTGVQTCALPIYDGVVLCAWDVVRLAHTQAQQPDMRRTRTFGVLAALPLLSGCIAVAALPLLAGGAMFAGGNVRIRAATPRPKTTGTVRIAPAAEERTAGAAIATTPVLPPALTQPAGRGAAEPSPLLPDLRPPARTAPDPWRDFFDYAADKGTAAAGKARGRSVLLEAGTPIGLPKLRQCDGKYPAVIVDLDAGAQAFAPGAAHAVSPTLVDGLAQIGRASCRERVYSSV